MSDDRFVFDAPVWRFGDDIDTDAIIPATYLNITTEEELKPHCMEDFAPDFSKNAKPGDILVAGKNFGCGSSREQAPLAIKACGISCVIASSFSRLFYRNAINICLPLITLENSEEIAQGDQLHVECMEGVVKNLTTGKDYKFTPLPGFMSELLNSGGLVPYLEKRLSDR